MQIPSFEIALKILIVKLQVSLQTRFQDSDRVSELRFVIVPKGIGIGVRLGPNFGTGSSSGAEFSGTVAGPKKSWHSYHNG